MNDTTKRSILRWIHLVFTIPILGTFMVRLRKSNSMPARFDLSSFR